MLNEELGTCKGNEPRERTTTYSPASGRNFRRESLEGSVRVGDETSSPFVWDLISCPQMLIWIMVLFESGIEARRQTIMETQEKRSSFRRHEKWTVMLAEIFRDHYGSIVCFLFFCDWVWILWVLFIFWYYSIVWALTGVCVWVRRDLAAFQFWNGGKKGWGYRELSSDFIRSL